MSRPSLLFLLLVRFSNPVLTNLKGCHLDDPRIVTPKLPRQLLLALIVPRPPRRDPLLSRRSALEMVLPSVSCLAVSPVAVQVVLPCECGEAKKIAMLIAAAVGTLCRPEPPRAHWLISVPQFRPPRCRYAKLAAE